MGKIMYWLAYYLINFYFKFIRGWKVEGRENIPDEGPLIVMANHISALDPPIVGCIMNRQVHFMAKKELFSNPVMAWIFKKIGVFPVNRGKADLKALRRALQILKEEKVLGLFPEGTRHNPGEPGEAKGGAILIALKTESPILPVGIKNVNNEQRLKISIGRPFTLDQYYNRKLSAEEKDEAGELIMNKIKKEI